MAHTPKEETVFTVKIPFVHSPAFALDPLSMEDLRPHLGELNWQLRRAGIAIGVLEDSNGRVTEIQLAPDTNWTITCDACSLRFEDLERERFPKCPACGHREGLPVVRT